MKIKKGLAILVEFLVMVLMVVFVFALPPSKGFMMSMSLGHRIVFFAMALALLFFSLFIRYLYGVIDSLRPPRQ